MEVYTYEAKSSINQNNNISLSVSFAPKQQLVNKEDGGVCVEVYKSIKKIGDILPSISNFSDEIKTWVSAKLSSIDNALLEPYKKINMMDYVSKEVKEIPLLLKNWECLTEFSDMYLKNPTVLQSINITNDGKIEFPDTANQLQRKEFINTFKQSVSDSRERLANLNAYSESTDKFLRSILLERKFRLLSACLEENAKCPENNLKYASSCIRLISGVIDFATTGHKSELKEEVKKLGDYINKK